MNTFDGKHYSNLHPGKLSMKKLHVVRRYGKNWCVVELHTLTTIMTLNSKLKAYYVCSKYNDVDVSVFFHFGTNMFK